MKKIKVEEQQLKNSNDIEKKVETTEQKQEVKHYDYGHLVLYCGKCKSKYIIEENIPGNQGIQIVLPPTNTAEMRLVCKDCKNEMALFYIESTKKKDEITEDIKQPTKETEQEGDSNESISEESTDQKQSV